MSGSRRSCNVLDRGNNIINELFLHAVLLRDYVLLLLKHFDMFNVEL